MNRTYEATAKREIQLDASIVFHHDNEDGNMNLCCSNNKTVVLSSYRKKLQSTRVLLDNKKNDVKTH